jgi:hypothetical protein
MPRLCINDRCVPYTDSITRQPQVIAGINISPPVVIARWRLRAWDGLGQQLTAGNITVVRD